MGNAREARLGFETALQVDPINDFTVRGITTDSVTQQLPDTGVVILIHSGDEFHQLGLQNFPVQMIFIGTHDHGVLRRNDVIADQQLFVQFFSWAQPCELNSNIPLGIFSDRTLRPDR